MPVEQGTSGAIAQAGEAIGSALQDAAKAARKPGDPVAREAGQPRTVYSTQPRLGVTQAVRYINQELGFTAFRQVWSRQNADLIVRPTPWPLLQRAKKEPGTIATSFVAVVPETPAQIRWDQVVVVDPTLGEGLIELLRTALGNEPGPRQTQIPAQTRPSIQRKYGELTPSRTGGLSIVAVHELGHTLGLGHYDEPAEPGPILPGGEQLFPSGQPTITTGGYEISDEQTEFIRYLLGIPEDGES